MITMSGVDLRIRSFEMERDHQRVVELEKKCEIATKKKPFLITDTLGDPLSRIRNSPLYSMLVAELENELVGIICGSIKIAATGGGGGSRRSCLGYILGLRVSPLHQRTGIGSSLVLGLEQWFQDNLVDYVYMATEKSNEASLKLFTYKLGFVAFRTPAILVNPVGNHLIPISSSVEIKKLEIAQAEYLYRKYMCSTEFFPQDIDSVLRNKLSFGTWLAYPPGQIWNLSPAVSDSPSPRSWAMLSVWNCTMVYKIKVVKAPWSCAVIRRVSSWLDKLFPWLRVPVMPNVFSTFGYYFMYGMHAEGPQAELLMNSLCLYVHNMATKSKECEVIVAEVGGGDAIRSYIPHWKSLSFSEDIWCIKPLQGKKEEAFLDWTATTPPPTIFFDPRNL